MPAVSCIVLMRTLIPNLPVSVRRLCAKRALALGTTICRAKPVRDSVSEHFVAYAALGCGIGACAAEISWPCPSRAAPGLALEQLLAADPTSRDLLATAFTAVGSLIWVKIFDTLADRDILDRKLSRKLVHITTGERVGLPLVCPLPFLSDASSNCQRGVCFVLVMLVVGRRPPSPVRSRPRRACRAHLPADPAAVQ